MVRRTVTIPDDLDRRVRGQAQEGESFSAAVARILEQGLESSRAPSYVGSGEGPGDSILLRQGDRIVSREEELLAELVDEVIESESPRL